MRDLSLYLSLSIAPAKKNSAYKKAVGSRGKLQLQPSQEPEARPVVTTRDLVIPIRQASGSGQVPKRKRERPRERAGRPRSRSSRRDVVSLVRRVIQFHCFDPEPSFALSHAARFGGWRTFRRKAMHTGLVVVLLSGAVGVAVRGIRE